MFKNQTQTAERSHLHKVQNVHRLLNPHPQASDCVITVTDLLDLSFTVSLCVIALSLFSRKVEWQCLIIISFATLKYLVVTYDIDALFL